MGPGAGPPGFIVGLVAQGKKGAARYGLPGGPHPGKSRVPADTEEARELRSTPKHCAPSASKLPRPPAPVPLPTLRQHAQTGIQTPKPFESLPARPAGVQIGEERHCALRFELIIGKTAQVSAGRAGARDHGFPACAMKKSARPSAHTIQNRDRAYTALPPGLRGRRARDIVMRYRGHFQQQSIRPCPAHLHRQLDEILPPTAPISPVGVSASNTVARACRARIARHQQARSTSGAQ